MRTIAVLAAVAALTVLTGESRGGSWYVSVTDLFPTSDGVYDESTAATNQVDIEHPLNAKTLAQFSADVGAAHVANHGTVIGFDHGRGDFDLTTQALRPEGYTGSRGYATNWIWTDAHADYQAPVRLWYGVGYEADTEPLSNDGNGQFIEFKLRPQGVNEDWQVLDIWVNYENAHGTGKQISGPAYFWRPMDPLYDLDEDGVLDEGELQATAYYGKMGTHPSNDFSNVNGKKTVIDFVNEGGDKTEILELGITALSQGYFEHNLTVSAVFSGGATDAKSATIVADVGNADTFFHFAAPEGETIVQLIWESDQERPQFDDLAFILPKPAPPPIPGDANLDGTVDGQDFAIMKAHFGAAGDWGDGDFTGNGTVDGQDFSVLKANFGQSQTIPEPLTLSLLAMGALAVMTRKRRIGHSRR